MFCGGVPFTSKNLKKIYHKQIIVYELDITPMLELGNQNFSTKTTSFLWKNHEWVKNDSSSACSERHRITKIHDDIITSGKNHHTDFLYFNTFEEAYISKVKMIRDVWFRFNEEVQKLLTSAEKGFPDLSSHMKNIEDNHSEYLL